MATIHRRDYDAAAEMIDVFRLALRALDDAVEMERRIPFPLYREFVAFLRGFGDDWLRLSLRDIDVTLEACRRYRARSTTDSTAPFCAVRLRPRAISPAR